MGGIRGGKEGLEEEFTRSQVLPTEHKERIGANRAALSIARKLIGRAHHTLIRELGEEAISEPVLTSSGSA